ncbi:TPA: hypothetical protein ACH3X1_002641 [Trebouxia sp. C0004]
MTERAEAESRQTGQRVSPRKYAKIMDVERAEHGKSKDTGKPTPVASWVKTVLGPMRAHKNKKQKGVCVCVRSILCFGLTLLVQGIGLTL